MRAAIDDVIALRQLDVRDLKRMMRVSFGAHVVIVLAALLVPRDWLSDPKTKPIPMRISLGGSSAPKTDGMNPMGGKAIEKVAPPVRRPEPVRPEPPKPDAMTVPSKTPPKPDPKAAPPKPEPVRQPTTGRQVMPGTSRVETPTTGQGTGLSLPAGPGAGAMQVDANFCCPEYLIKLRDRIQSNWRSQQPERGMTILTFTVMRDGRLVDVQIKQSSGSLLLDAASRAAVTSLQVDPLPREYGPDRLIVHLTFPYERL